MTEWKKIRPLSSSSLPHDCNNAMYDLESFMWSMRMIRRWIAPTHTLALESRAVSKSSPAASTPIAASMMSLRPCCLKIENICSGEESSWNPLPEKYLTNRPTRKHHEVSQAEWLNHKCQSNCSTTVNQPHLEAPVSSNFTKIRFHL